jgi:hypothetical protein
MAIGVAEVTHPHQHVVAPPFDGIHDSLTSLRDMIALRGERNPDRNLKNSDICQKDAEVT